MARRPGTAIKPARTPLRRWHVRTGRTWAWLAERADVSVATVLRAAAGQPVGPTYARAIALAAGLHPSEVPSTTDGTRMRRGGWRGSTR